MEFKLTLVTINYVPRFIMLPIVNGKPKLCMEQMMRIWNVPENACIWIG